MQKILVVEDEDSVRENILELLDAEGYQGLSAENGITGVRLAREQHPDLILCDILMPKLDGYGVWTILNKESYTATIPFIFLTAKADRGDLRKGMELGVDDYITKPFTREELLKAIQTRLEKQTTLTGHANRKLQELRSSIVHSLPHEMLTPLSVILGYSELLHSDIDYLNRDQMVEMARDIQESANRLLRTIQNYLMFSELEMAATDPAKIDLLKESRLISAKEAILDIAWMKGLEEGCQDRIQLDLVDASIRMSEMYIHKIIEELLDNALKYSPAGSLVNLKGEVDDRDGFYVILMSDSGRGMSPEQVASIDGFIQFDRRKYEQQGSGMGLAIIKRLVTYHEGDMDITSVPGKGTTVRVRIPICA